MATQRVFDQPFPPPEQIQAAIQRAHRERSQALRRFLIALFSRRKPGTARGTHGVPLRFAGHC
jgi:hypothetical protein